MARPLNKGRGPRGIILWTLALTLAGGWLTAAGAQDDGVRRALLIGVGDYRIADGEPSDRAGLNPLQDLQGPINDVRLMSRVLITRFAFKPENVTLLTDAGATRSAILEAISGLVQSTSPGDTVYIHFSGYGSRVPDRNGDEADGWDETILSHDARTEGVADITDDEIDAILRGLPTSDSLLVLDAGTVSTLTTPGSEFLVRAMVPDDRDALYETDASPLVTGGDPGYVVMYGAAPGQFALEGPVGSDRVFGWFSWSLARVLSSGPQDLPADQLQARVQQAMNDLGDRMELRSPASMISATPDARARPVLGADRFPISVPSAATRSWIAAEAEGDGRIRLEQGALFGATAGSLWAVYPPGTVDFSPANLMATSEVLAVIDDDARAQLDGGGTIPPGSRAVMLAPASPERTVPVWLHRISGVDQAALRQALAAGGLVRFVDSGRGARFIVNLDDRGCRVFGPGGLQEIDRFPHTGLEETAARLATLFERSARLAHLQSMDNPSGAIQVDIRVAPIDIDGTPRLQRVPGLSDIPVFRTRGEADPRGPDNSLMMLIRSSRTAYITVVDIGPEGGVTPLFPNPVSDEREFFPEGRIPPGQEIRIPDSLTGGQAGFYIDYEPPEGHDTLRVFAAGDPLTAALIRDYLGRYLLWIEGDGPRPDFQELFLPLELPAMEELGSEVTGFGTGLGTGIHAEPVFGSWAASSVSFRIDE